jgi:CheY-like chemotaxis protein
MLNIINDNVSISKIESGQMEVSITETNVNEQIEYIYNFFTPEVEKKRLLLLIKNTPPTNEAHIKTDREKLYAILTNLVKNAIKFTHTGSIEFGVEKKGSYLEFFVKDTGEGIRQQQKGIIFERFRQGGDLITRYNEGAGLGLSIAKAYVEKLGGKIRVESEVGKGSIFYFTLPYNTETEAKTVNKDVSSGIGADNQIKNLKILIAEDDQPSEMLFIMTVKKICKVFLTAGTGLEAVESCRNNPDIDLVLMDIKMPKMYGYKATRQIRQFNKDVIIIAQTAYGFSEDREKAIEAGCNDYISKPVDITLLKELIQKYFNN